MANVFDDIDAGKYGGKARKKEPKLSFLDRMKAGAKSQGDKIRENIKEKIKYNQDIRKASKEAYRTEYKKAKILEAKRNARAKAKQPGFFSGRNLDLNKYDSTPGLAVEKLGTRKRQRKDDDFNYI